jgi:hypothetical protein
MSSLRSQRRANRDAYTEMTIEQPPDRHPGGKTHPRTQRTDYLNQHDRLRPLIGMSGRSQPTSCAQIASSARAAGGSVMQQLLRIAADREQKARGTCRRVRDCPVPVDDGPVSLDVVLRCPTGQNPADATNYGCHPPR